MSAVRFHTYWAPWEGQDGASALQSLGQQPCPCPCSARAPGSPRHLALGLPLLHQVAAVQPDSTPCSIIRVLGVWGPAGKHVLAASAQDHLGQGTRAGGLGAWQALCPPLRQLLGPPLPPPGLWRGSNDCTLYTPQEPRDPAGPRAPTVGCLGLWPVRGPPLRPGPRWPSRRTSMSMLETSCVAMSWQPSFSALAGMSASEYQLRFTVCA